MPAKFELTAECKEFLGIKLFRIRALIEIERYGVKPGDFGGFVEKDGNLSQSGNAWVSGNARVSGDAWVSGSALVSGNALVSGDAWVSGSALVSGNAQVYGDALVSGNAWVSGSALVYGNAQVYGNAWVYGNARVAKPICSATRSDGWTATLVATPDGPRISAGCQFVTFAGARKYVDSDVESLAIIDHFERMSVILGYDAPVVDASGDEV